MAVRPDRKEPAGLEPAALEALAEAGRAAARGERLTEVLEAVVAAAAEACGAEVALARVIDPDGRELVVRAAGAASESLVVELRGGRVPLEDYPTEEIGLERAPPAIATLATRVGAESALVIPITVLGEVVGSLELLATGPGFDESARTAARVAANQFALAIRAFGRGAGDDEERPETDSLRLAGEALAAGADPAYAADHVLRLALDVSGAVAGALWTRDGRDELVLEASVGELGRDAAQATAETGEVVELAEGVAATLSLGHPSAGVLQLGFPRDRAPDDEELRRLEAFALRAARALHAGERALRLTAELEQTRALLAVVGQATAELSLAHTLDTAIDRVAHLVGSPRLAVYLLEGGRLVAAADRGLAGPHVRVAEALLELAVGPFRGRGIVSLADATAEPRLSRVADAISEAGIEAAIAAPLFVGEEATGVLCVYPTRRRTLNVDESGLLAALAGQLAVAVQNARLHEEATRLGAELEHALASEREAARRLRALYEISSAFAQSLSLDVTLEAVARTVVELLDVDAAVLGMPDQRGEQLLPLALHAAEPRLLEPVRSLLYRPQPFGRPALRRLFRAREPIVLDAETAASIGSPHALLAPFLEQGSTAAMIPIATPAEVLGSLTLLSLRPDRPIDDATIESAAAIGAHAALAIDNARLYQQQKDFADAMQRSLLPQVRPAVDGLDIGEVYAASAHVDVGGDLYDYIALPDGRLAVVVGDVTGHGIDAAADMAMAKFIFRSLAREHPEPPDFLAAANEVVVGEIATGKFITMLYLVVDPRTGALSCGSAGHPPPRLVFADGTIESIDARGLALGVEPGIRFRQVRAGLEPGGAVVLYTDGVIEARAGTELYGVERLDALLSRRRDRGAEDIAASVIQSARRFTGGELLDDCAVVVLKLR
jgi:serine phosphatase RsbU (regulator of sigma subunit)